MKRTQLIEAVRNIRRNRVPFLSVIIISMLAVTAYLGLDFSAEGVKASANTTYAAEAFADAEISAARLLTQEDLDAVLAAEGVADAEGILAVPSRISGENGVIDIGIRSLPERISLPNLTAGRLPEAADECAMEEALARKEGYRIGDTVRLAGRSAMTDAAVKTKAYTVTGLFTTAEHLTDMVSWEPLLLTVRGAFNTMLLGEGRSTRILVRLGGEAPDRFSPERKAAADGVRERLEALDSRWIVTALHHTAAYICTEQNAQLLATVSLTFSMLFIVIAALVIYSTIGRLVAQDSRLVGAEKAMGLRNGEIFAKYLLFGTGGTLTGAAAGILAAYFAFERIILLFFGTVFTFRKYAAVFRAAPAAAVTAGAAALSVLAVFLACRRLLGSTAVSLMSGQAAMGKQRRRGASGSGPLYIRLMLRNMRADWKRVLVSIVSIAGCCMLLMIGFSLKFAVSRVPERQFGEIQRFALEIVTDPAAKPEAREKIGAVLAEEGIPFAEVCAAETVYKAGAEQGMLTLICPGDGTSLTDYYHFQDPRDGSLLDLPASGLLVTAGFAEEYGLGAGDTFQLYDSGMNAHTVTIAGIFANYTGITAACSRDYAEECLGEKPAVSRLLPGREPQDPEALRKKLAGMDGFVSLESARKQQALFDGMSTVMNLVILLLGLLAFMIACFILLNLVSTYVNQKRNELTIMRINGYTSGETIRYASMECYGITALGILLGLIAGQAFSVFLIRQIGQIAMRFVEEPVWISFAASAAVTAAISWTVHFLAFRKIRGLKLSDLQK